MARKRKIPALERFNGNFRIVFGYVVAPLVQNLHCPIIIDFDKRSQTASAQPAITVLLVAGLANPDYLIEIDGMAFIPD